MHIYIYTPFNNSHGMLPLATLHYSILEPEILRILGIDL